MPTAAAKSTEFLPSDPCHLRALAISAPTLWVSVLREVHRMLAAHKGNQLKAMVEGLDYLVANGLISTDEHKQLGEICNLVCQTQLGKLDPGKAGDQVRGLFDRMIVDWRSTPVALAIAGIASSHLGASGGARISNSRISARISQSDKIDAGILGGAIAGAGIGGAIGGAGGAVIGAVVGGIAAGVATACAT
jgi:hypothetical protein